MSRSIPRALWPVAAALFFSAPVTAAATAEEVLRVIYGEDLEGCTANLDEVTATIRAALGESQRTGRDIAKVHAKAFEAVELLSTPPADGQTLSAEDLRSLLGERLDKIRTLATQVLRTTSTPDS